MNISLLSEQLLEEAITEGTITLNNRVLELTASQIITVIKYILDKKVSSSAVEDGIDIPQEMLSLGD